MQEEVNIVNDPQTETQSFISAMYNLIYGKLKKMYLAIFNL